MSKMTAPHSALEAHIVDGKINGLKVYGHWFYDLVLARAGRDKTDPALLNAAIIKGSRYAVRGYTRPAHPSWKEKGEFVETYTLRGDGKVVSGTPSEASCVLASEPLNFSQSQCADCLHWQKRGGIASPRTWNCTALEDESPSRVVFVVTAMARLLAGSGQCPTFSTLHVHQDGYISQDLPR